MQISESHCGPAVIQMLLAYLGIEVAQDAVAEAGGANDLIEMNGMRVDQLAKAVSILAPQARFWWKTNADLDELVTIVRKYQYPVGVEWQGVFEDEEQLAKRRNGKNGSGRDPAPQSTDTGEINLASQAADKSGTNSAQHALPDSETEEEDFGHYSVVTHVRRRQKLLIIADPYKDYFHQDRIFSYRKFNQRWWDYNEVPDPRTGRKKLVEDYHMMFIITEAERDFPRRLKMKNTR